MNPDIGPMVSDRHRRSVERYIAIAEEEGGVVSRFGAIASAPELAGGFFVRPAIVEGVLPEHTIFSEEIFGPVLAVTSFQDIEEAIALANASEYGLNAGLFSSDISTVMRVVPRIRAGMVYVNGYGNGGGVEVPFGGFGKSGIGRQKGIDAAHSYTQVKSVTVHF
jgi:acyl-CoA reductase-like NAD-dependent aldehyde dehydrogenase